MTSSKYCQKTRNGMKLQNSNKLDNEEDHDLFLSKLTSALRYNSLNTFSLNPDVGRLPLSELTQKLQTGKLITKFDDYDSSTESEDESPYVYTCSFVLAILYFERLKVSNPSYLKTINSSELFLVSLLVASKYLQDDGELDSAINSEWAAAYGISLKTINQLEKEYLIAMNWQFFISDEEFTNRHKQIINQKYSDMERIHFMFWKIFLFVSSFVQTTKRVYFKRIKRMKIKDMIAMSTVITVMTASAIQIKINLNHGKQTEELYEQVNFNPNNMISSAHTDCDVYSELSKDIRDISNKSPSYKLIKLLDHLLLMNNCISDDQKVAYQSVFNKLNKTNNITLFKIA